MAAGERRRVAVLLNQRYLAKQQGHGEKDRLAVIPVAGSTGDAQGRLRAPTLEPQWVGPGWLAGLARNSAGDPL